MKASYKIGPISIEVNDPSIDMNMNVKIETVEIVVEDIQPENFEQVNQLIVGQLDTVFSNIAEGADKVSV